MTNRLPIFSIIIPTHDRPTQLARALAALARLDFPRDDFEVVVVDDGSETLLVETLASFQRGMNVALVTQSRGGPAAARNAGAAHARGTFLAFTDDDCAPAADWLRALAARMNASPQSAVGGRTLNALSENIFSTASQLLIQYLYAYYNRDPDHARFLTSNNLAVPRERFVAIGGFDPVFPRAAAEDRDFCDRWLLARYPMVYAPEAVMYHANALTFKKFLRQHWEYGRGAFRFRLARARRHQAPVRIEPLSFYSALVGYPFTQLSVTRAFMVSVLFVLAQVANAAGFTRARMRA